MYFLPECPPCKKIVPYHLAMKIEKELMDQMVDLRTLKNGCLYCVEDLPPPGENFLDVQEKFKAMWEIDHMNDLTDDSTECSVCCGNKTAGTTCPNCRDWIENIASLMTPTTYFNPLNLDEEQLVKHYMFATGQAQFMMLDEKTQLNLLTMLEEQRIVWERQQAILNDWPPSASQIMKWQEEVNGITASKKVEGEQPKPEENFKKWPTIRFTPAEVQYGCYRQRFAKRGRQARIVKKLREEAKKKVKVVEDEVKQLQQFQMEEEKQAKKAKRKRKAVKPKKKNLEKIMRKPRKLMVLWGGGRSSCGCRPRNHPTRTMRCMFCEAIDRQIEVEAGQQRSRFLTANAERRR